MRNILASILLVVALFGLGITNASDVNKHETLVLGASGYDVVSYWSEQKAQRGSGYHVTEYKGVNYLFSSEENLNKFNKNPDRYLPAYGGYCAYGVAVGKKFAASPEIWKIVDGKLYFNLDSDIQKTWEKELKGNIKKADKNWKNIRTKAAKDL